MQYNRKMGIDYGDKRIGIAFTDLLCVIASAYEIHKNNDIEESIKYLSELAREKEVNEIVIGLPLNMQGEENERTKITRFFGDLLEAKCKIPVVYEDERLSSVEADEILKRFEPDWLKRKEKLDMYSAQVILQSYLDNNKRK